VILFQASGVLENKCLPSLSSSGQIKKREEEKERNEKEKKKKNSKLLGKIYTKCRKVRA
jgi:hypothetical protein